MKRLIVALLMIAGLSSSAQDKKSNHDRGERMTTEQRNELHLKKMALELDLNSSQQKEMAKVIADQSAKRTARMAERKANKEKGIKPTADQRFAMQSKMLDEKAAMKERVKKTLTPAQFEKWEMKKTRHEKKKKMAVKAKRKSVKTQDK